MRVHGVIYSRCSILVDEGSRLTLDRRDARLDERRVAGRPG
jgi:hypothetical protein